MKLKHIVPVVLLSLASACGGGSDTAPFLDPVYSLTLDINRVPQPGFSPISVTVTLQKDGNFLPNKTLTLSVPRGVASSVVDQGEGKYEFTVTPASTGVYPIEVSFEGVRVTREALVFDGLDSSVGQPLAIPGNYVNTAGYEDGVTITPDGQYLFVQYGPIYFSGLIYVASHICTDVSLSIGYDLNNCNGADNSNWLFKTIGPYNDAIRPNFPSARISSDTITHLSSLVIANVANGVIAPPTVFYGFKRQLDDSFAEPFKVAFDDQDHAIQGPFGLSFTASNSGQANVLFAWNDFTNQLGDDKADIYSGAITLGQATSLGSATYDANDLVLTTTPSVSPINFNTHVGTQGNPHVYYDSNNIVRSIWVDDEIVSHDLTVYRLTSGSFPSGTWSAINLPSVVNTGEEESQPFFTGNRLYIRRGIRIVYHRYQGSGGADYHLNASWGPEVIVIDANLNMKLGEIIAVGEPTIATVGNTEYLYFVYGWVRSKGVGDLPDINLDAGFVKLN